MGSLGAEETNNSPPLPPPRAMSRIWKFIKENPYVSTALVFGSVGMYIYWDQRTSPLKMLDLRPSPYPVLCVILSGFVLFPLL